MQKQNRTNKNIQCHYALHLVCWRSMISPAVVTMCPVFLLGLGAGQWTAKIRMDFCGRGFIQKRGFIVSASKARNLSHYGAARQRSLRSLDSSRMGPLQTWGEDNRPHPGVRAFGDQKPFEERFLDFQTFLIWVRCRTGLLRCCRG